MSYRFIVSLLIFSLVLISCAQPTVTEPISATENTATPTAYPGPAVATIPAYPYSQSTMDISNSSNSSYPGPGTDETGTPAIPPSGYEPQLGDENLKRDPVFLDLPNSQFSIPPSPPFEVQVVLQGNLPDPCHQLRVVVTPPDANNVINLEAYSVVDPAVACITVLKPFTANIPLGTYLNGDYLVMVNGEGLGNFGVGSGIAPAVQVTP
jgi:hypothetical protein